MSSFFQFAETFLWVGFGTLALLLFFLFHASRQAPDNPLRIALGALATRLGVTLGLGMLDIPITMVEPIGGVVDVASIGFLAYYWFTGVRQMLTAFDAQKSLLPPRN